MPLTLATWNLEWATARQKRSPIIHQMVSETAPDIVCFTEANLDCLPVEAHVISSGADYGYGDKYPQRRKVVLTSSDPWEDVANEGPEGMPPGRFVSGITHGVRVLGVCIPWADAHVSTGRKDAKRWEEHMRYLNGLERMIQQYQSEPLCVVGDFNQRVPKGRQPQQVLDRLLDVFSPLTIHTAHHRCPEDKLLIDHVATSGHLSYAIDRLLPMTFEETRLSDHNGHVGPLCFVN
ncbi:endonuclease/exonuclease/phosphatase family protein [Sulfuriroseicoccus oceanibius]|uniref:Endonuclease/exonuclease/phosphatase family protein n=1 Tax=Sulfuriroseicoccus oceanibius TaxID=2707525 RepID=A0A6B3L9S9_9BACT|nr:endonuclease/exonuclease/phosphatase family protein [Sulfuriroseicoccus oceanibius]QQL43931.1 endonuclease/exonuclease/phosphatase family protein [Sulfuriroseicoccus oceanibius]